MIPEKPYIIEFSQIGNPEIGYLSVAESSGFVPFEIRRVYWSYYTPHHITRGRHAHHKLEQVLVAVSGIVTVTVEQVGGVSKDFVLNQPNLGLYLPPKAWHVMEFSHNGVLMSLASMEYDESDYIRDYEQFLKMTE